MRYYFDNLVQACSFGHSWVKRRAHPYVQAHVNESYRIIIFPVISTLALCCRGVPSIKLHKLYSRRFFNVKVLKRLVFPAQ